MRSYTVRRLIPTSRHHATIDSIFAKMSPSDCSSEVSSPHANVTAICAGILALLAVRGWGSRALYSLRREVAAFTSEYATWIRKRKNDVNQDVVALPIPYSEKKNSAKGVSRSQRMDDETLLRCAPRAYFSIGCSMSASDSAVQGNLTIPRLRRCC